MDLKNKKVTVVGFQRSGMAVCELVLEKGGVPRVSETKSQDVFKEDLAHWPLAAKTEFEFGGHTQAFIKNSDFIVLSPGVRIDALPVEWARAEHIPVIGEIELAWRFCPCPVVAVTGSNGKTTVSTLIAKILEAGGRRVCLCGNIGSPFSKYIGDLTQGDIVVLEVSSFQLESIVHFRPHVAVFTNFSQNHLDRHKDIKEYFDSKARIFMNQTNGDFAVLNYENETIRQLASKLNSVISYFNPPGIYARTSLSNPNHLAALEAGRILGVPMEICLDVFKKFKGVEHRLEFVRSLDGIDFINDSKSTTVESGRWALERSEKPVVMICGGRDKNADFSFLKSLVKTKVKAMIVIGEAREKLRRAFENDVDLRECQSLEAAVVLAKTTAKKGDCVLFSPMCASFDMFKNFEDRGRCFKEIVSKL